MCSYFDDLGIDNNYKYALDIGWLTDLEFGIIKDWHKALEKYNPPGNDAFDHAAILSDPIWLEILRNGLSMKGKLLEILTDTEKKILTEDLNHLRIVD